jgi:hypothetical protein
MEGEGRTVNVNRVDDFKQGLAGHKEVLAVCWELLTWKRDWYPVVLVSAVTFAYTLIWWNDVTVLTSLSLLGILLVCVDLASTHARSMLSSVVAYTPEREHLFTDMCIWLSQATTVVAGLAASAASWRETNSIFYYTTTSTALLVLAWIGSLVPNMLLCYWATAALVLLPGISRNGLVAKYASRAQAEVQKVLRRYLPVKRSADATKQE